MQHPEVSCAVRPI